MNAQAKGLDYSNWTTQVRKGLLELCILNLLARGELYGYDLVKELAKVEGLVITEGTVYPLLSRLKKAGLLKTRLVESATGPARKYYSLSREGNQCRVQLNAYWNELSQGVSSLVQH